MTESALIPSACAPEGLVLLRAAGEDAEKFLHGQFTNRVEGIGGAVRLAGWCDGRGRLHAVLRVWAEEDGLRLLLPAEIADRFLKHGGLFITSGIMPLSSISAGKTKPAFSKRDFPRPPRTNASRAASARFSGSSRRRPRRAFPKADSAFCASFPKPHPPRFPLLPKPGSPAKPRRACRSFLRPRSAPSCRSM